MENWKFALSSIMSHKMRAFLTMLGIIIGVASVVLIMALGNGMRKSVTDSFSGDKKDIQLYFEAESSEDGDNPFAAIYSTNTQEVKSEWLEQIVSSIRGIRYYYVTNTASSPISYQKKEAKNVDLTGVSQDYFKAKNYDIVAGRSLQDRDYQKFSRLIVIDTKLADKLFSSPQDALNKVVSLGQKDYLVIGVYKVNATAFTNPTVDGSAIMANTQLASEYGVDEVGSIYVHVDDASQAETLGTEAAAELTRLSRVRDGQYTTIDMSSIMNEINQVYGVMTLVIGSIAGISLLVGGIGVMNIMLVSVTERTREIGLRKALGATRRNILTQFLIESIVLTILGGLIGLSLAYGLNMLIANLVSSLTPVISLDVALIAISFSALIGIVFGLLPANKASKLDPIEALRYE